MAYGLKIDSLYQLIGPVAINNAYGNQGMPFLLKNS